MATVTHRLAMFLVLAASLLAVVPRETTALDCGPCDKSSCGTPGECLAGLVKDSCDCCLVCGRLEGQRCGEDGAYSYGKCGEQLECKHREDIKPEDPPEAICFCKSTDTVCGSDGKTYENRCKLTEAAYRRRDGLKVTSRGPCIAAPWIVTGPEDVTEKVGANVALACEAMGFPIPSIEWHAVRHDGTNVELPSDNQHVAVQARGGPEQYEITGWLQLLEITSEDAGTYDCVARNAEGEVRSTATVSVIQDSSDENQLDK